MKPSVAASTLGAIGGSRNTDAQNKARAKNAKRARKIKAEKNGKAKR